MIRHALPCFVLATLFVGCSGDDTDKTDTTETDTDTDSDTDADTDSDADTDVTSTADTSEPEVNYTGSDFALMAEGVSKDCRIRWDMEATPASYTCSSCKFELDWQFDVLYTFSKKESTVDGCLVGGKDKNGKDKPYEIQDAAVANFYSFAPVFTKKLSTYYNWIAHVTAGKDQSDVLLGFPVGADVSKVYYTGGTWDQKSGDFTFNAYYGVFTATGTVTESTP
ncbi:MAG: hypothetical protein KTR31_01320 [Myxococcales bacterium]|nr:hypothetical protein [Myxococcales bacterium]